MSLKYCYLCTDKVYPDEAIFPTNCKCKIVFHDYCWEEKNTYAKISVPIYIKKDENTYELINERFYKKIEGYYECWSCHCKLNTVEKKRKE